MLAMFTNLPVVTRCYTSTGTTALSGSATNLPSGAWSVKVWVKANNLTGTQKIFDFGSGLTSKPDGGITGSLWYVSPYGGVIQGGTPPTNTWVEYSATHDGAGNYTVNGGSGFATTGAIPASGTLYIGRGFDVNYWNGRISNFRLWDNGTFSGTPLYQYLLNNNGVDLMGNGPTLTGGSYATDAPSM
jgi:hypothetical protein